MARTDERRSVVGVLAAKHPAFPEETIERLVGAEMEKYRTAKVQTYVPVLVQRMVDRRLREAAALGSTDPEVTSVLTPGALPLPTSF